MKRSTVDKKKRRWLAAWGMILGGIVASFVAAGWVKTAFGLPAVVMKSRSGSVYDLTEVAIAVVLLLAYLYIVPKLFRLRKVCKTPG
jgi:hypothetical protein